MNKGSVDRKKGGGREKDRRRDGESATERQRGCGRQTWDASSERGTIHNQKREAEHETILAFAMGTEGRSAAFLAVGPADQEGVI
jgi:hypothetical protein